MKKRKNNYTSCTNLRIPFVPWNTGPNTGSGKSNPYTLTLRAAKLARKKEAYLAKKAA